MSAMDTRQLIQVPGPGVPVQKTSIEDPFLLLNGAGCVCAVTHLGELRQPIHGMAAYLTRRGGGKCLVTRGG